MQWQHIFCSLMNSTLFPMTFNVIITHHPDTTIAGCHGDTSFLFHREPKEVIGKKLVELGIIFYDEQERTLTDGELPVQCIAASKKPLAPLYLGFARKKAKPPYPVRVTGYPELDESGNVSKIITSYTGTAEEPLQDPVTRVDFEKESNWEKTFNAIGDIITILTPDLKVVKANKATYSTFGLAEGELLGKYCHDVFFGRSQPCDYCPVWQPERGTSPGTGIVYNEQINKTLAVSSSPILDDQGKLQYLVHTARDVSQQRKNEEVRNILSAAVEQTSDSIIITDHYGNIQYINPFCSKITGYSREDVTGKNLDFLHEKDQDRSSFSSIAGKLWRGESWQGRLTGRKKDGTTFAEDVTISPITDEGGNITNCIAVKRDVSKEEQLQLQLQQAMKMEAIGTLAGGIAHDFNNILAAMIGYAQIAKGKLSGNDPANGDIEEVLLAGDRAANLVKQILTFSRQDKLGVLYPTQIPFLLKEVVKLLRSSLPTTIEIRQDIDPACAPILADPTQIHQVLMNLCTNAKQAIGDTYGSITITLKNYTIAEPQLFQQNTPLAKGKYLHLSITDSGIGMDKEMQAKVFDPFFTTKPKNQGTGLGLAVVHGIVEGHRGVISIDSIPHEGTTFHLFFPAIEEKMEEKQTSKEAPARGTEKIMVVDDEKPLASMLKTMLGGLGYSVEIYTDSLAAVANYRRRPQDFDVIITDMTMPNMTGTELTREARSLRPEIPIILMTGYSESINEEKAAHLGLNSFLLKPISKTELAKTLRRVLDHGIHTHN